MSVRKSAEERRENRSSESLPRVGRFLNLLFGPGTIGPCKKVSGLELASLASVLVIVGVSSSRRTKIICDRTDESGQSG